MINIKQLLNRDSIENPGVELARRLKKSGLIEQVKPDARIAITAGSRGINGITPLVRAVADVLKDAGVQ